MADAHGPWRRGMGGPAMSAETPKYVRAALAHGRRNAAPTQQAHASAVPLRSYCHLWPVLWAHSPRFFYSCLVRKERFFYACSLTSTDVARAKRNLQGIIKAYVCCGSDAQHMVRVVFAVAGTGGGCAKLLHPLSLARSTKIHFHTARSRLRLHRTRYFRRHLQTHTQAIKRVYPV